jgi:predicted O-methyltransferase YrrM
MIQPIEGWLFDDQERWLFKRARSLRDGANIVEIGSYKGRSTCCLGFGCRGTKKRVFAIDRFDGGPDLPQYNSYDDFCANVKRCGLSECIQPVVGSSSEIAKDWNEPIGFLFIDGSHLYEDVVRDFENFFPHVVSGGLIAFHDVHEDHPGVLKAWHEIIKQRLANTGFYSTIGYGKKP